MSERSEQVARLLADVCRDVDFLRGESRPSRRSVLTLKNSGMVRLPYVLQAELQAVARQLEQLHSSGAIVLPLCFLRSNGPKVPQWFVIYLMQQSIARPSAGAQRRASLSDVPSSGVLLL